VLSSLGSVPHINCDNGVKKNKKIKKKKNEILTYELSTFVRPFYTAI